MSKRRRLYSYIIVAFVLALSAFIAGLLYYKPSAFSYMKRGAARVVRKKPQTWMVIFVHGTFQTGLGLLNVFDVLGDNIHGSMYQKISTKMRKDPFNYQEQAILAPGLLPLNPTYDIPEDEYKFAAYPLAAAYQEISQTVRPKQEKHLFYAFGWSGLMSQTMRRQEALAFYNALARELERLKEDESITPKIRIIAHSHGGNLALNLGAVHRARNLIDEYKLETLEDIEKLEETTLIADEREAVENMTTFILKSPVFDEQSTDDDKHNLLSDLVYRPFGEDVYINELIMLGTPIQPETSFFCFASNIRAAYNIYSEQDLIQAMDFVSTKKGESKQRIEPQDFTCEIVGHGGDGITPSLNQAKIMVEKDLTIPSREDKLKHESFLQSMLKVLGFGRKESKDPSHKDLWFFSWLEEYTSPNYPFHPLPLMVFTPLLIQTINGAQDVFDLDLNMIHDEEMIAVQAIPHEETEILFETSLPRAVFEDIKKKIAPWKPEDLTKETASMRMKA